MKLRLPDPPPPVPSQPTTPSNPGTVTPQPGTRRPGRRRPEPAPVEEPPNDFGSTLEDLLGNKYAKTKVSEEEIYAALILYQLKDKFGQQYYDDWKATFKLNAFDKPKNESFASAERAANDSMKFFTDSTLLTEDEAQAIKDKAFAMAQLDSNKGKLWDHAGETVAVSNFANAQRLMQARINKAAAEERLQAHQNNASGNLTSSVRVKSQKVKTPKISAVG